MADMSFNEFKQERFSELLSTNLQKAKETLREAGMSFDDLEPHSEFAQSVVQKVYEQTCTDLRSAWIDYKRASKKAKRAKQKPPEQWTPPSVDSGDGSSDSKKASKAAAAKRDAPQAYEP